MAVGARGACFGCARAVTSVLCAAPGGLGRENVRGVALHARGLGRRARGGQDRASAVLFVQEARLGVLVQDPEARRGLRAAGVVGGGGRLPGRHPLCRSRMLSDRHASLQGGPRRGTSPLVPIRVFGVPAFVDSRRTT